MAVTAPPVRESPPRTRWWKGARGEWYVVAQIALFILVAVGPRRIDGLEWPPSLVTEACVSGAALMIVGAALLASALAKLGRNLTTLPYPKDDGILVQTGAYRLVRHPIYTGAIALAVGWAFCVRGPLTLAYAVMLFVLFDLKSRREERWLVAKFPHYPDYQRRVRRLIPFLY
jgi:protein-S-isoprenylcysteine O-methyltransferase Ste14